MKAIINTLCNMVSMGIFEKPEKPLIDEGKADFIRVAAGDPAQDAYLKCLEQSFPDTLELPGGNIIHRNEFNTFVVDGFSMSPEDVNNGDVLLCKSVEWKGALEFIPEKFVVIKVDEKYYETRKKELRFRYKLRKTLAYVPADTTSDMLIGLLKQKNTDILLSENQQNLKRKLRETREYEDYRNSDLVLSITYREGSLRYSFHPISLVKFEGLYLARHNKDNSWTTERV